MNRYLLILSGLFFFLCLNCLVFAESCEKCHQGIEPIAGNPAMKGLECSFCHRGHPEKDKKDEAHKDMWANPSDYSVAEKTCGQCHEDILKRSKKSLHATSAGIISATRYLFSAQGTKNAIYAVRPVRDEDLEVPKNMGAVKELKALPFYNPKEPESPTNSPADDYLREQCLRCHLYSYGAERFGDFRSSGCAACHMLYDDDGKYKGRDAAIRGESKKKDFTPRPSLHRVTVTIPPSQCIHCHNRGGRTGVSFIGTMESDGYGSPWSQKPGVKGGRKIHGKYYNHLTPDVHYAQGLFCIDCHTERDVHGDGNIYSKKEQAVEIECQDCHGTKNQKSRLLSSRGNRMERLELQKGQILLNSACGKRYVVPQVKDILKSGPIKARNAMGISAHLDKMECYSCHSRWAPQCYGCHAQQDASTSSLDWVKSTKAPDPTLSGKAVYRAKTPYKWRETRSFLRWETPSLGINSEGLVSPFIPGCQVIFTQIGPDGKCRVHNKVYKTTDGVYAIATNPIQPHTTSKKARSCESCHANRKSLGLGRDLYVTEANGVDLPFSLEQIVDENGTQLQATSHEGARPFNKEEIRRIIRVGTCASCHGWDAGTLAKGVSKIKKGSIGNDMHRKILRALLNSGAKSARP